jgi:transcriptional regulator with XRE-family HTH domain
MNEDRLLRLGNYIRLLREAEGLSQEELAKKSGFAGRAAISAIEKGKNNISVDKLPELARALHTTPGRLMDVLVEHTDDLTAGLTPENVARLKSYADYLRTTQEDKI